MGEMEGRPGLLRLLMRRPGLWLLEPVPLRELLQLVYPLGLRL